MDSDKKLDEMIEKNQKRDEWQKKTVTEGVAFRDKVAADRNRAETALSFPPPLPFPFGRLT